MQPNITPPRDGGRPRHSCAYIFVKSMLRMLKAITFAVLLGLLVVYVLTIKGCVESTAFSKYEQSFIVLSGIGFMSIAIMQFVAEMGFKWFNKRVIFMRVMAVRGLLLAWQGVQVIELTGSQEGKSVKDIEQNVFRILGDVVGWSLIGTGFIFFFVSACRIQTVIGAYEEGAGYETPVLAASKTPTAYDAEKGAEKAPVTPINKSVLSPEARTVISNMAIALDLTSAKAWDLFNGPLGIAEARRMRSERAQLLADAKNTMDFSVTETRSRAQTLATTLSTNAPTPSNAFGANSPRQQPEQPYQTSEDERVYAPSHRDRNRMDDDALAAQYYASMKQ